MAKSPVPTAAALSDDELLRREKLLWAMLEECRLCPRDCRVNRLAGRKGRCRSTAEVKVASAGPHFGEERELVGRRGSGTIFFSDCSLLCCYCQNWTIAHHGEGRVASPTQLARQMLSLQKSGCHNINLVTPTHVLPQIVRALRLARRRGLTLPLVYNTGGYDRAEVLRLLDGLIDIYMPDFKYQDGEVAARLSARAQDYPEMASGAIREMQRQVGVLRTEGGVATRGLLLRHLVLPNNLAGTDRFVRWVAATLGTDTRVNIMGQYRPAHRAWDHADISRGVTREEMAQALRWARAAGLRRVSA